MWADPDADYEKLGAEQAELEDKIDAADAWDLERNVEIAMDALRCPPGDADVTTLSGGERRRVALCRLLLSQPDLLLLDEPTNHLDAESVAWLERFLQDYPGTVVAVTHDRYFLDNVAGWILELDRGRGIPCEGNYSSLARAEAGAARAARRSSDSARQRTLERELEWVRMAPKARQAKGKARLAAYEKLLRRGRGRRRRGRQARDLHPARAPPRRHGDRGRGPAQGLRRPAAHRGPRRSRCRRGGIVGVIGPNGAGKTTLFRMITGAGDSPTTARCTIGETVEARLRRPAPRHARRRQDRLRGDHRRRRAPQGRQPRDPRPGLRRRRSTSRAPTSRSRSASSPAASATACTWPSCCKTGGNVLLLDEPTNDLDVDTLRALEDGARGLRRLRRGHQPRPLVPRPHRHPHAGLRGRQPGALVRGQLHASTRRTATRSSAPTPTSPTASSTSRSAR